jgi:hypothetical protein
VNGVKGLFAFHKHPHPELMTATTDYMHAFYNLITDFIDSARPTHRSYDMYLGKLLAYTSNLSLTMFVSVARLQENITTEPIRTQ